MLDLEQIESFYPSNVRYFKKNILREYLQYKILEIIFDSKFSMDMNFMGGTAIRIIHDNNRFSEDLDFDNLNLDEDGFTELGNLLEKKLTQLGYVVEIKMIFKQAFHCNISFLHILNELGFSGHRDEKIVIRIDTEPQKIIYNPEKKIINKFDVFTLVNVVPIDILLSQKLLAFLKRKRIMGRDLFDIVFLTAKTKPNLHYLDEKDEIKNFYELKEKLLKKCETINFKELIRDLEPFIINPDDIKRILLFKNFINDFNFV